MAFDVNDDSRDAEAVADEMVTRAGVLLPKRASDQLDAILAAREAQGEILDPLANSPMSSLNDDELAEVIRKVEADLLSLHDDDLGEQLTTLAYLIANPSRTVPPLWGAPHPALAEVRQTQ